MKHQTDDVRIRSVRVVLPPAYLQEEFPVSETASETVFHARQAIRNILNRTDDRLLVVVGPCSIHDVKAACEYATLLKAKVEEFKDDLCIVMRVYFEKPRTTVGWKGLINDPYIDGSSKINDGLKLARKLLVDLAEMGVPAGSEFVDLISPQYTAELISWGAIGARTTESQSHRELASGLSCPVGFKNGTGGTLQIAVDAVRAATHPHYFLSHTKQGQSAIFETAGNPDCHVILRGGRAPNYDAEHVAHAVSLMEKANLPARIMVDCSHANSNKDHLRQIEVCQDVCEQVSAGNTNLIGVMVESHLVAGRQDARPDKPLRYGQSITDACIGWEDTETVLTNLAQAVRARRVTALVPA
ncbi:MAG: 3-deoxy-7-phosphoheptulonate synthase AroG [Blastocatellia bacterium]|nr:3-deoxy-7-phosphoheptulonate synthase AroG [Blastocatellia bacterium]